jgi:type 1 fimbriae regulatory protein FimB/type 1 fimbriae regulatory protein FimE
MSPVGFRRMLERLSEAAKMAFDVHPHMLRHACGFKLANQGVDTRSQHYLGHKNIQRTMRPPDGVIERAAFSCSVERAGRD